MVSDFGDFLMRLGHAIYNGGSSSSIPNTDEPTCPNCVGTMVFYGGDRDYGDGYWECPDCGFSFTEEDVDEYEEPNDDY